MPIDITGADGSLFWKAGIDTTDFDKGMQNITDEIQLSVKKQIQLQQQAAQGQKEIAQTILQSAGVIKGMGQNIESQIQNLSALQGQIQTLKGQTVQLNAQGFDTTQLIGSLDTVLSEIEKIKNTPLDITGKVDVVPLLTSLRSVQAEFDKLSGQSLKLNVSGINTDSVEKAFATLQTRIDSLNQTALNLKVGGVDTASLTVAIDKAKKEFESLKGLTLTGTASLDLTEFQKQYDQLQKSLTVLESEKIELKAQGIDTTQLEKDINKVRTQAASLSRQVLKIDVDTTSLSALEKQLQALRSQSLEFKAKGIDTSQLDAALLKVQTKIEQIKNDPVEIKTGSVNLSPITSALTGVQKQVQQINGEGGLQTFAEKQVAALQAVDQQLDQSEKELKQYFDALDSFKNEGIDVKVNQGAPMGKSQESTRSQLANIDSPLRSIQDATKIFKSMDDETQAFIKELVELELQLKNVKEAQKELDTQRANGDLSLKKYVQGTEALTAQQKNIGQSISIITQRQKEYEKSLEPVIEKTVSAQKRLSELKKEMASNPGSPMFETWKQEATELQLGINKVNQELKNSVALQSLQNRKSVLDGLILTEKDTTKVKAYKQELATIGTQLSKVSGTGVEGFGAVGNEIAKTAGKTNLLAKGFGFIRQAALFIPGIGIAGIFSLISDVVVTLVSNLLKGKNAFDEIGEKIKVFNEVNAAANKQAASQITDLKLLYKVATDVNVAMNDRLTAVKNLQSKFPEAFANTEKEIILNGKAKDSYLELIEAIQAAARAKAVKDKIDEIEAQRFEIAQRKQKIENATNQEKLRAKDENFVVNTGGSFSQGTNNQSIKQTRAEAISIIEVRKQTALKEQEIQDKRLQSQSDFLIKFAGGEKDLVKAITGTADASKKRSIEVIDAEIATQKKLQDSQSVTQEQYLGYQKKINELEAERKKIAGASKSETKATLSEENKLLSKRFQILQDIQALQRDATQSGLDDEASALDKINEKYDRAKEKAAEFNKLAESHNKTSKSQVSLIDTSAIDTARTEETNNQRLKDDAEKFKQNLEQQKAIFEQFEEAKKNIGVAKASEMFKEQTKGFTDYQEFLKDEVKKNLPAIQQTLMGFGSFLNISDRQKVKAIFGEVQVFNKEQRELQQKNLADVLGKTTDFAQARKNIEIQYDEDVKTLEKSQTLFIAGELEKRKALLLKNKEQELADLENQAVRQSEIYKLMGQDLILSSESKLKDISKEITKTLEQGFLIDGDGNKKFLTPEMIDNLTAGKEKIDGMLDKSKKLSDIFKNMSGLANNFNNALGSALSTLGDMVSAAKSVKQNLEAFNTAKNKKDAKGNKATDVLGEISAIAGIAGAVGGIVGSIGGLFAKSAEESKRRTQEIKNLQASVFAGEFEINSLYRERELIQIRLNDLRIQGAQQELELLKKQKEQIQNDAAELLKKLQTQTFTGTQEQIADFIKNSPNLSSFQLNKLLSDRQLSLSGKTFAELEKLNTFGQLEGTAKTLFDTLAKLKQEGVDVEQAIKDLDKQIKVDLTAGATKESLADSIAQGFEQGKRSAADFADTFKDLMQKAALAALKLRFLDEPLKKFIDQFQEAVVSGDELTTQEVDQLKSFYDTIITNAGKQFDQIQKIAGLDFNVSGSASSNSLQGAIKTIQEETAQLLAGQVGAMRINGVELLNVSIQQLDRLNAIQYNTGATVQRIDKLESTMVYFFENKGVKLV